MQTAKLFGVCAMALLLASWNITAQAEEAGSGGGDGQAEPEASAETTTVVITEPLPGAISADIVEVKCPGKTTSISARACDTDNLDDAYTLSIVGDTPPAPLNNGDRGFIRVGPVGGCTFFATTARVLGSTGTIKAYVTVSQQVGGAGNYVLTINCNSTTIAPTVKFIRDSD